MPTWASGSLVPRPFRINCAGGEKGLVSTVWMTSCFGMILRKMSSRLCTCRIHSAEVAPKHSTAWFSPKHSTAWFSPVKLKVDLPGCLSWLLSVPVSEGDTLPSFICRSCQVKAESIESKLHKLRKLVKRRYN